MPKTRRARIEWFAATAGYCTPPGRLACAKSLADAEEYFEDNDLRVGAYGTGEDGIANLVLFAENGQQLENMGIDEDMDAAGERVAVAELTAMYLARVK